MCHSPHLSLMPPTLPASLASGFRFCAFTYRPHCFLTNSYFPLPLLPLPLTKRKTETQEIWVINSGQIRKATTQRITHLLLSGYMIKTAVHSHSTVMPYPCFGPFSPSVLLHPLPLLGQPLERMSLYLNMSLQNVHCFMCMCNFTS